MPILLFLIILLFSFPTQALTCGEVPSCESLGFSNVDNPDCPSDGYLYCPFDKSYKKCVVKGGINCKDHTLKECPEGATDCTACGKGKLTELAYKVDGCQEGYGAENAVSCAANACDGYTLSSCNTQSSICSDCLSGTTTKYKLDDCQEGYKLENGTCVAEVVATVCEVGDVYYLDKTCGKADDFDGSKTPIGVVFYVENGGQSGKIVNLKDLTMDSTTYTFDPENPYNGGYNYMYMGLSGKDIPITDYTDGTGTGSLYEAFKNNNADLYDGKTNTAIISAIDFNDSYNNCKNGTYTENTQNYAKYCVPTASNAALAFYPVPQARGTDVGEGNWYLPAIGELAQLYGLSFDDMTDSYNNSTSPCTSNETKVAVNNTLKALAALDSTYASQLTSGYYWSSSEYNSGTSWDLTMTNGSRYTNRKTGYNYVRVILAF